MVVNDGSQHHQITRINTRKIQYDEYQAINYLGENEEIGAILALINEKFHKKVMFSIFQQKPTNYILIKFDHAKDTIQIFEHFKDLLKTIIEEQSESTLYLNKWLKQKEGKKHIHQLTALENNKESLFGYQYMGAMFKCIEGEHQRR